ncbi:hypothetical protein [Ignatzschineria cameli]|uniref:hypothetical protein n=1 Tax=Ignatzschineria cameli TaxID=2182793 RepID=UPI0013003CF8|nr:hypothetical protein [Ignatzschineria cameli]
MELREPIIALFLPLHARRWVLSTPKRYRKDRPLPAHNRWKYAIVRSGNSSAFFLNA